MRDNYYWLKECDKYNYIFSSDNRLIHLRLFFQKNYVQQRFELALRNMLFRGRVIYEMPELQQCYKKMSLPPQSQLCSQMVV